MKPSSSSESQTEQERRTWVERHESFRDLDEDYNTRLLSASPEERHELQRWFSLERTSLREEDIALGKRSPGLAVRMHRIMWAQWIEVAIEHELEAWRAFREIVAETNGDALVREFRASLVAITAAAHTIEAVFGDIKCMLPVQQRRDKRHKVLRHAFCTAFGLSTDEEKTLAEELSWLFTLRDMAAHPYTEPEAPEQHPAGVNTGAEHSLFNAETSRRAVDAALMVLGFAATPPLPLNRWIQRWAGDRAGYHSAIQQLDRDEEA
jgi:hypothetical protein